MLQYMRDFFAWFGELASPYSHGEFKFIIFLFTLITVFFHEVVINSIREVFFGKKTKNLLFR